MQGPALGGPKVRLAGTGLSSWAGPVAEGRGCGPDPIPSMEPFWARLDGALSNLVWLKMSLLPAGGLG